jgi:uncharacterized Rmd1/YagE family protein
METKKLTSYLLCDKFNDAIYEALDNRYKAARHKDVVVVDVESDEQIVLFRYGVIVCWNISYENLKFFQDFIRPYMVQELSVALIEELQYEEAKEFKIYQDVLFFEESSVLFKIALSHPLAQHIKLELFEQQIEESIEENATIAHQLVLDGKIKFSKKEISQKIGELFLVKSKINLHYDLLDTPEFIWEYSEYEVYYEKMIKYLDLRARVEVLNKKVEVIQEILDMLGNEQNHKYSSFLEWIIIILIAFEIIMNIVDHLV